jgi:CheY-like chemotaxis protein
MDAIERVVNNPPDLILMDIVMPKLDGITASERIRQF